MFQCYELGQPFGFLLGLVSLLLVFLLPAGLSLVHCIINPFLYVRFLLFFGLGFWGVRGAFPALIAFGTARRIVCATFGAAVGEPLQVELEFVCHVYPS